jgi:hypothetical protein
MKILAHKKASSTPYKKAFSQAEEDDESDILRPTFTFMPQELNEDSDVNQTMVLLVGLAMRAELPSDETSKTVKPGRLGVVGTSRPAAPNYIFNLPKKYTGHETQDDFDIQDDFEDLDEVDSCDSAEPMDIDSDKDDFLLVVRPCYSQAPPGKQTKLFVLMKPKDGLCHLYNISGAEVFYFSEFRNQRPSVTELERACSTAGSSNCQRHRRRRRGLQ